MKTLNLVRIIVIVLLPIITFFGCSKKSNPIKPNPQPSLVIATCDEFEGTTVNSSIWNNVSGTWTQQDGQLNGYANLSAAHSDQANLLLVDSLQPTGEFTFDIDLVMQPNQYGHRIVLYHSAGNKYNVSYHGGAQYVAVEVKTDGNPYHSVGYGVYNLSYFDNSPGVIDHAKVTKSGKSFTFYLNDHELFTLLDSIWNGDVKIGLGAYGYVTYEKACIKSED